MALDPGTFAPFANALQDGAMGIFTTREAAGAPPGVTPFAVIRGDEGVTLILTRAVPGRLRPGGSHAPGEHPLRHRR